MNESLNERGLRVLLIRGAAAAALLLLVGGCAFGPRFVRTEVTTYNQWSLLPAEKTYVFSRTLEYQNSLELKAYEDIVSDELSIQGFKRATDEAQANLVVTLRPSSSDTRVRVRDPWPDPFYSSYGFYGRRGFGYGGFGYGGFGYGGFGGFDPYWSGFSQFDDYSVDIVQRRLEMDIDSRTVVGKRFYEGKVETSTQGDSLKTSIPFLVRALFTDFPGNNGQTRRVDVPVERR